MMRFFLLQIFFLFSYSNGKQVKPMSAKNFPSAAADSIMAKLMGPYSFGAEEIQAYQKDPLIYSTFLRLLEKSDDSTKVLGLESFDDLGAVVMKSKEDSRAYLGPYIKDLILVKGMVGFLSDKNEGVREEAIRQLTEYVPDVIIRKYAKEIIDGVAAYPTGDLRNPMTYEWNGLALRSIRVHIIEGLGKAYPMEELFWRPNGSPENDTYYDAIEGWATAKLGVTWDTPRPSFLYQMDAPIPIPGH